MNFNILVPRIVPVLALVALTNTPACGAATPAGPTAQATPTPAPTPAPVRSILGTGTFNDDAPGPTFAASNTFLTFTPQAAGRMDIRATWGTEAQVRIYIYAGACDDDGFEAGRCGTLLQNSLVQRSSAVMADVGVPDTAITLRFENMGPGPTGPGVWEAGLIRYQ